MPHKGDPAWHAHTTEATKEDLKAGIPVMVKGWKCKHCSKDFWNKDVTRLMSHLSGQGGCSIEQCSEVTKPISDETKVFLQVKTLDESDQ